MAATQTDVKRLLAYSTISHCGFLFVCVGLGNALLIFGYLFLHGLFKAGTFFAVGPFIRRAGSQDLRAMGSLSREMPLNGFLLGLLSTGLGGFPFTFGYLYKQLFISWSIFYIPNITFWHYCWFGFLGVGLLSSFVYIFKLNVYCLFYKVSTVDKPQYCTTSQDVDYQAGL